MNHCQHCQDELSNKRAKQCPACADIKNEAYRRDTYRQTMAAMKQAADEGSAGDEFRARVAELVSGVSAPVRQTAGDAIRAKKAARHEREERNAVLKAAGFQWSRDYWYDRDHYEEEDETFVWRLIAPDGEEIDEAAALRVARGESTLEQERGERAAERQAAQAAEAEAEAAEAFSATAWEQARADATRDMVEVEPFDYSSFHQAHRYPRAHGSVSIIYTGEIGGVACAVAYRYSSLGNDYDIAESYWSANPEAAGLVRLEGEPGILDLFFGA